MGIAMSLVWHFQKGISCRGKFAVFGLVWFGGHPNQLLRSPLQCPWSAIFKKVYHVGVNLQYLVWFGLVWRSPKSAAEVTIAMSLVCHFQKGISCRGKYAIFGLVWFAGHPNQLQRSPLQCPWSGVFKKVYHVGVNIDYLGCLHWSSYLEVTMISCRGHHDQLQRSPKSAAEVFIALYLLATQKEKK